MSAVIVCQGLAGRTLTRAGELPPVGQYLKAYDPEAQNGQGWAEWTPDLEFARRFRDAAQAMECWRAVPANRPRRGDGKPNRPLTAFTVMIEQVP